MKRRLNQTGPGKAESLAWGVWISVFLVMFLLAAREVDARSVQSADKSVSVVVPETWQAIAPPQGAVLLLLVSDGEEASVTVLREPVGEGPILTPIRYLFMKMDNFGQSFKIEAEGDPVPLLIAGTEAARTSFTADVRQADGSRRKSGFVFTCLLDGRSLYTLVGNSPADDFGAWRPILDAIAGSLQIGSE